MLISRAFAHGSGSTGSSGGGHALLIILAIAVTLGLLYAGQKRWRGRRQRPDGGDGRGSTLQT